MNTIKRPLCKVRGRLGPRAMCGSIITGLEHCGFDGECEHKVINTDGIISMIAAKRADERAQLHILLEAVLSTADEHGFVVTVTQEPLEPLAMGNYKTVFSVREKREKQ